MYWRRSNPRKPIGNTTPPSATWTTSARTPSGSMIWSGRAGHRCSRPMQADTAYRMAQANVAQLQVMKSYEVLRAPFDGTVTARFVDVGGLVQSSVTNQTSNQPVLTMADMSRSCGSTSMSSRRMCHTFMSATWPTWRMAPSRPPGAGTHRAHLGPARSAYAHAVRGTGGRQQRELPGARQLCLCDAARAGAAAIPRFRSRP